MPRLLSELSRRERAGYIAGNAFIRGAIGVAGLLPYRLRVPAMGRLVRALAPLAGYHRRIRNNLALTCPELSTTDVNRLCHEVCDNAGRTLIELYAGQDFLDRAHLAPINGPGLKALEEARAAGRPVVLVTGHFGNYDAARANLIGRGFAMGALYRRMANPYFNAHYVQQMSAIGTPMFEQGRRGMVELVRHLKSGGIVAIVADLHVRRGEQINFFGKPASTSTVPAELALKYNAALIPVYATRQPDGLNFTIEMQEEIPHGDPTGMTQAICDGLEGLARRHMGQWFWIHRRWKGGKASATGPETSSAG